MSAPLTDPGYVPLHPPVDGAIPEIVARWGPRSQLRWFERFGARLAPQPAAVWDRFYCSTEAHRGGCCSSCVDDQLAGYGGDLEGCCCRAVEF